MSLMSRLERRFGRFAIPNLTTALVIGQACLYVANITPPNQGKVLARVWLDPALVMQGQWWRVLTFLIAPPAQGPLFVMFYFILLHLFGTTLERHWGAFRYNMFLLIGWAANVGAAFAASAIAGAQAAVVGGPEALAGAAATNGFLYSSLFLAFARLYPDFVLNLFFVLPIRIKWLALLQWIVYGYLVLSGIAAGEFMAPLLVIATVLNYLMFFGAEHVREWRHGHRRRSFQVKAKKAAAAPRHECRVCGANSTDAPKMLFRYCSKCEGQQCYCPEHIRNHEHVTAETPVS
jgi:hypothetical protein